MALNRRTFLKGIGGALVALPFFEGLAPRTARASDMVAPFALFYRRGNGVQQALYTNYGARETERWWPNLPYGAITQASLAGTTSAINELSGYASKLAIVRGLRHPVGTQNGHREGYIQGLTGAGVRYPNDVPNVFVCDPKGESLDNRIARELSPSSPFSLYLGVGSTGDSGQKGDAGISFINQQDASGAQINRAAEENYLNLYNRMFLPTATSEEAAALLQGRRKSVNDLVRDNLKSLQKDPRLSKSDLGRLDLHMAAIRDAELALTCNLPTTLQDQVTTFQGLSDADRDSCKGNTILQTGVIMAKMVSLAVVCGTARSILLSMGPASDTTSYNQLPGCAGIDFHDISHRHTYITNPDQLHHAVDRLHLQLFRGILDALAAYTLPDGTTYVDKGISVHYADIGSGAHVTSQLPYLYVGSAGGALQTGQLVNVSDAAMTKPEYVARFLNTIGAAVGCKNASGDPLDNFNADNNGGISGRIDALIAR